MPKGFTTDYSTIVKDPDGADYFFTDFTKWLGDETLVSVAIVKATDVTATAAEVLQTPATIKGTGVTVEAGKCVRFFISGGTVGTTGVITLRVTATDDSITDVSYRVECLEC